MEEDEKMEKEDLAEEEEEEKRIAGGAFTSQILTHPQVLPTINE